MFELLEKQTSGDIEFQRQFLKLFNSNKYLEAVGINSILGILV